MDGWMEGWMDVYTHAHTHTHKNTPVEDGRSLLLFVASGCCLLSASADCSLLLLLYCWEWTAVTVLFADCVIVSPTGSFTVSLS